MIASLRLQEEEARRDPEVALIAGLLSGLSGGAAKASQDLKVVLAGVAAEGDVGGGAPMQTLEDLQQGPGGRHDNDSPDFRWALTCPRPA